MIQWQPKKTPKIFDRGKEMARKCVCVREKKTRIENDLCDHGMFYLVAQQLTHNNNNTHEHNPWHRFVHTSYANCAAHFIAKHYKRTAHSHTNDLTR